MTARRRTARVAALTPLLVVLAHAAMVQAMPAAEPAASDPLVIPIWPTGRMPGRGADGPETSTPGEDRITRVTNVSAPTLTISPARAAAGPSPIVVVCPGGGYGILAIDLEGGEIATWLSGAGFTAAVLKYRVPDNRAGAFQDVQRAVRCARAYGARWGGDPARVAVLGFSAGGHLCARASTAYDVAAYDPLDDVDRLACRPDAAVLVYPAYLERDEAVAPDLPITAGTSPTAIAHSDDDAKFIRGSVVYHAALERAGIPTAFLHYRLGGHGYGLRCRLEARAWPEAVAPWLRERLAGGR